MMPSEKVIDVVAQVGDAVSLTVLVGYLLSALPTLAVLFTVIWTAIRIYETDTFQRLISRGVKIGRNDDEPLS